MNRIPLAPRTRRDLVRAILVVGLAAAAAAFATAPPPAAGPLGDPLEESKAYRRNLEVYGGTANVLATELREGFLGLWRGRALGLSLAALTLAAALGTGLATRDRSPGPGGGPQVP